MRDTSIDSGDGGIPEDSWYITAGPTINFYSAPANGAAITVTEYSGTPGASNYTNYWAIGAFNADYGYPAHVEYYSDRLTFAGSVAEPQTIWMSKTGAYDDFGKSVPLVDDDALTFTVNSRQINQVQDLIPLDSLVLLTTGAEWQVTSGANDVISPSTVGFKSQSFNGSSAVPAQIVNYSAIYVQQAGQRIRDIGYTFDSGASGGYRGSDLTALADHLVEGYAITESSFAQAPFSVVWFVRNDGILLGLTYMREQEVVGWFRVDTDGEIESVCTIPNGSESETWISVKRTINGVTKRYIERFSTRSFTDSLDYFFVDCGLTYDGRNSSATTMTLSGSTWTSGSVLTLAASAASFTGASDIGDEVDLSVGSDAVRVTITGYTDTTHVTVETQQDVPASLRAVATATWTLRRDTISGLSHLEGKTVSVLADAAVQTSKVVSSGAITLDSPGGVVHVGLPYRAEAETLEVNVPNAESVRDKMKNIPSVTLLVQESRGFKAGRDTSNLEEYRERSPSSGYSPVAAMTGVAKMNVNANWDRNGSIVVVQDSPLPCTILAFIPEVKIGGS